jgi:hypothetical protein
MQRILDDDEHDEFTIVDDEEIINNNNSNNNNNEEEQEEEFDINHAMKLFSEEKPRPLSPIPSTEMLNPFRKNDSWEEYQCSLAYTCMSCPTTNDPFREFLKQEFTSSSTDGTLNNSNYISVRDSFDQYSRFHPRSIVKQKLKSQPDIFKNIAERHLKEKRLRAPKPVPSTTTASEPVTPTERIPVNVILGRSNSTDRTSYIPPPARPINSTGEVPHMLNIPTTISPPPNSVPSPITPAPSVIPAKKPVKSTKRNYSDLSASEHAEFLEMWDKIKRGGPEATSIIHSGRYIELSQRVQKEQNAYSKAMFEEAMMNKHRYRAVHESVDKQIDQIIQKKKERILELPAQYLPQISIYLEENKPDGSRPILRPIQRLLRIGKCKMFQTHLFTHFVIPDKDKNLFETEPVSILKQSIPITEKEPSQSSEQYPLDLAEQPEQWKKVSLPSVSTDPVVNDYLLKNMRKDTKDNVTFVMSSSPLITIFSSLGPRWEDEWTIPVTVTVDDTNNKCIYLDKPILKKKYTSREKNTIYYKNALKCYGINMRNYAYQEDFNQDPETQQFLSNLDGKTENLSDHSTNLVYRLFELEKLKLLVRYTVDGVMPDASGYIPIGVKAKLDYLGKRSEEQIQPDEAAKLWLHTYIKENAELVLGRVDLQNSTISTIQTQRLQDIIATQSSLLGAIPFNPELQTKRLHTILSSLSNLEAGKYIVQHVHESKYVNILQAQQNPNSYNLHLDYQNAGQTDTQTIPYIPKKWTEKTTQIPYTFKIDPASKKKQQQQQQQKQQGKKRKRQHNRGKKNKKTRTNTHPVGAPINPIVHSGATSRNNASTSME